MLHQTHVFSLLKFPVTANWFCHAHAVQVYAIVCVCVCTVTVCCGYVLLWGCTGFQYCQFHDQIELPLFEVSGMPESALLWSGLRLAWPEVVYSRNVWV